MVTEALNECKTVIFQNRRNRKRKREKSNAIS